VRGLFVWLTCRFEALDFDQEDEPRRMARHLEFFVRHSLTVALTVQAPQAVQPADSRRNDEVVVTVPQLVILPYRAASVLPLFALRLQRAIPVWSRELELVRHTTP